MGPRKRGREEMESSDPPPEPSTLHKLRNMWEFANIMQYIYIFGEAVKIDNEFLIEDLEEECLKPEPSKFLSDIGLALLKFVSSHRGLTPELFDEYTRRQYVAKAPQRNPFGIEEEPKRFAEFDIFTKIRVLVQLSQWTLINPDRMKEKMHETKDLDQTNWRMEECGYDRHDRLYYIFDDNRLYRRTYPPLPPMPSAKPKSNSKKARAAARASKRRKTRASENFDDDTDIDAEVRHEDVQQEPDEDGFGGQKWECVAISLGEYQNFLSSIEKSRDPNEKALHKCITEDALPTIAEAEEKVRKKKEKHERELLALQKMASAKRSSRLEAKHQREIEEQATVEEEKKRQEAHAETRRHEEQQKKLDDERRSRIMTREQRLRERDHKRLLREEELASLSEENRRVEAGEARGSERYLKAEMEKKKKDIAALQEEDDWFFDCAKCGVHGSNVDDGTHSVACERCNVWQHSACLGISKEDAEKDDFHFVCHDCKQREEDAKKPKIPTLKFHVNHSTSPHSQKTDKASKLVDRPEKRKSTDDKTGLPPTKKFKTIDDHRKREHLLNGVGPKASDQGAMHHPVMNGSTMSLQGQQVSFVPPTLYAGNASPPSTGTFLAKAPAYASGAYGGAERKSASRAKAQHMQPIQQQHQDARHAVPSAPNAQSPEKHSIHHQNTSALSQVPSGAHQLYPSTYQTHFSGLTPSYQAPYQFQTLGYPNQNSPSKTAYSPQQPYATSPKENQRQSGPSRPPANPYANSFDRQPPSSLQHNQNIPSPLKKGPTLSPSHHSLVQPGVNGVSASSNPQQTPAKAAIPQHSQSNGFVSQNLTPQSTIYPTVPPAFSPTKHDSPSSSFAHNVPAASPITSQPPLPPAAEPTSPGYSPQKHSSPPSQSPMHYKFASSHSVLPPAPKLSPGPTKTFVAVPSKDEAFDNPGLSSPTYGNTSIVPNGLPSLTHPENQTNPEDDHPEQQEQEGSRVAPSSPVKQSDYVPKLTQANGHAGYLEKETF